MNNARFDAVSAGLAAGTFWAIGVGGMTIVSGLTNSAGEYSGYAGPIVRALVAAYPGYNLSVGGLFIGVAWALVDGFVSGAVLASLYNFFSDALNKRRRKKFPGREADQDIHVSV